MRAILVLLAACSGGKPPDEATSGKDAPPDPAPSFVEIDLSEDPEDLDGIELRKVTADCGNLLDLEPAARLGRLSDDQIRCLNDSMSEAQRQTAKDKLSRVLLADAWAKGDVHRWMGVAARHLEEIDRSDPDMVFQFAYNLVQIGNPDRMDEALYWAGIALENKSAWEGDLHVRRVYALHKIRTMASYKKWEFLERSYKSKPTEPLSQDVEQARNELKTNAREWLEYAKGAGRDTNEAMQLCAMAAGAVDFCEE
jgi:hypothetical protein